MAKKLKAEEEVAEVEVQETPKAKKGGFVVLDSNGKEIRTVETVEEAESLCRIYGGRIKR